MLSFKNLGLKLFFLLPLIILLAYWYVFSVDIPWYDDVMVLAFNRNISIQGFDFTTLKQLFANYNEHIIVITKLVFWLNYKLLGYINLSYIALEGVFIYITFILLFIYYAINNNWYFKIIAVYMLSSLVYDEGYLWAMSNISNFASLIFTFISIILVARNKIIWSSLFLFLGVISCAQSLLFLPIWVLVLIYNEKFNWKIVLFLIVIIFFFFSGYQNTGIRPDFKSILLSFNKERILNIITFWVPPFGSLGFKFTIIYFCFEFLMLLVILYNIIVDYFNKQLTTQKLIIASLLIWSLLILSITFIMRTEIESRYLIFPIIKTTCVYLYFFELKSNKLISKFFVFLSVFFYLSTFLPSIVKAKNNYISMSNLKYNLLKNKMSFFFGTQDVDARKIKPYYFDLKPNEIVSIPKRLDGRIFSNLLLFNQISYEYVKSPKFDKKLSPLISQDSTKYKLLAQNIVIDSLSSDIVYQNKLLSNNLLDTYFILLKSKELSLLFNFYNEVPTLPKFAHSRKFVNQIVVHKNTIPYGHYKMYLIRN